MEPAFRAFSAGQAVVPTPGELLFENPTGDVHIKYGYIDGGAHYVVKIASGFYENPARGLPSSNGLMLAFSRQTGELAVILDDQGYLTDLRTAAAGAVAAKYLAPAKIGVIGIIGTGMQAELQARLLQVVRPCRRIIVWGRRAEGAANYAQRLEKHRALPWYRSLASPERGGEALPADCHHHAEHRAAILTGYVPCRREPTSPR